jgi:hypothetical protein
MPNHLTFASIRATVDQHTAGQAGVAMAQFNRESPTLRIGVFDEVAAAERAVLGLIGAGFRHDQISVLCSDAAKEQHFREFEHEDPAGAHTPKAVAAGSVIGGMLGGLVSLGVTTAAGLSLLAAGPSFIVGGAVVGGFIGAMQTRGHEGSLADFYDQALTQGKLLVAAEDKSPRQQELLARAERVFADAGALPMPLEQDAASPVA